MLTISHKKSGARIKELLCNFWQCKSSVIPDFGNTNADGSRALYRKMLHLIARKFTAWKVANVP
jgi:hypothetical protein